MSAVVGALRVTLGLDSAAFENGLGKANKQLGKFSSDMTKAFAAIGAAVAAATAAVAVAVGNVIDQADDMSKLSQKLGIPIEGLSQLAYAADLAGVPIEGLSTAFKKLSTAMSDAQTGGKFADTFKALGINVKDAQGNLKSSISVFTELSGKFASMRDGAQKTALAVQLFGKAGMDMIPLLNGGAESIKAMMKEADALGLTLDAQTGVAAEQFNDNLSRLGYVVKGLTVQLTAALAPALAAFTDGLVVISMGVSTAIRAISQYSDIIAVAATSMVILFSPAIVSSIVALTTAIGVGLVGAINSVTVAILANPLGALAVGIAAVITTIYVFRDEIQQAIGVDVVQITRDAANLIINSFTAAFEDIKFLWANFPDIIGAATIGAVNAVVSGIQTMVAQATELLNGFVDTANGILSKIGVNIPKIAAPNFAGQGLPNEYADRLAKANGDQKKLIEGIMASDPLGALAKTASTKLSSPAAPTSNVANYQSDVKLPSTGGGGKQRDLYADTIQKAQERIALLRAEQQAIGQTELATIKLRREQELINQAQDANHKITPAQTEALKGLAAQMAEIEVSTKSAREAMDFYKGATKGFLSDLRSGLDAGKGFFEAFGNAAKNVLDKVISKIEDQLVDALFSLGDATQSAGIGGAGGLGSTIGSLFGKLFGFATGGSFQVGGSGGIDSQLVAFKASPNETVSITKPGQVAVGGGGGEVTVNIINNSSAGVKQSQRQTSEGLSIDILVDEAVAKNMAKPGSATRSSMQGQFGLSNGLNRRG
jgi:hypothetical protein